MLFGISDIPIQSVHLNREFIGVERGYLRKSQRCVNALNHID